MPIWVALLAAIIGALLGAAARPIAENWFERRRKTLRIILPKDERTFVDLPYDKMQITWADYKFSQWLEQDFYVVNRTGRSYKDISIWVELIPIVKLKSEENRFFDIMVFASQNCRAEESCKEGTRTLRLPITYLADGAKLQCKLIATAESNFEFFTKDDIELLVSDPNSASEQKMPSVIVSQIISIIAVLLGAVATIVATDVDFTAYVRSLFQ